MTLGELMVYCLIAFGFLLGLFLGLVVGLNMRRQ
jgi:hypothetical protein